jgi:hypothetical protein
MRLPYLGRDACDGSVPRVVEALCHEPEGQTGPELAADIIRDGAEVT